MGLVIQQSSFDRDVRSIRTQYDAFKVLKNVTEGAGLDKFIVCNLPSEDADLGEQVILTNWPAELVHRYDEGKFVGESQIWRALSESVLPYTFEYGDTGGAAGIHNPQESALLMEFGMNSGAFFTLHQPKGAAICIGFSSNDFHFDVRSIASLYLPILQIGQKISEVASSCEQVGVKLTAREKDCLMWTASGKTSSEIATILALSEHTVNHYLIAATRKLDAVSRPHAVAKALRCRLID